MERVVRPVAVVAVVAVSSSENNCCVQLYRGRAAELSKRSQRVPSRVQAAIPTAAIPVSLECLILGRKFPQRQDAELPLKLNDLF